MQKELLAQVLTSACNNDSSFSVFNSVKPSKQTSLKKMKQFFSLVNLSVIFVLCSAVVCHSYVLSVKENSKPFLEDASPGGKVLQWKRGIMLQRLTSTTALRVTDNRMRFILHGFRPRIDRENTASCLPVSRALCQIIDSKLQDVSIYPGSFVFPTEGLVIVSADTQHKCTDGHGREVAANLQRYDVSACDVVDTVMDVFYTSVGVQVRKLQFNISLYTFVGMLVVIIIVIISQNLAADIFTTDRETASIKKSICISLGSLLVACSCFLPGFFRMIEKEEHYTKIFCVSCNMFFAVVTELDEHYFYFVLIYFLIQIVLAFMVTRTSQLHNVNFMLASILLTLFSTHGSMETILTTPLVFALTFRMFFKSFTLNYLDCASTAEAHTVHNGVFEPLFIALDYLLIAATYVVGMEPLSDTMLEAYTQFSIVSIIAAALAYEASVKRCGRSQH